MSINRFDGRYGFLSNFYPACVHFEGLLYPTVEHAYQAAKTVNITERRKIQTARTAGEAKRIGRRVWLRRDWDAIKVTVMRHLLIEKFRDPALSQALLATGDEELIEGNHWGDRFWGVDGTGENMLGQLLMQVRHGLRSGRVRIR